MPGMAYKWPKKKKQRRVAHSVNLHWCSSHSKFVSGDLGTWVPGISVNSQPILFPAPLAGSCFKASSGRSHSSCRDISQQGPQAPPARKLVTGNPMACSVPGCPHKQPLGIVTHCQIWQLSPRLEHGHVESIDQLARYHTQFNTPTEWRRQFCPGETRFDRYAVHPELFAFRFGKPKKQSCRWSTCLFLFASFLTSYAGIPSATHLTTI